MKLEVTITGTKLKTPRGYTTGETEDYTHSVVTAQGEPQLIADALRAMANNIAPQMPPLMTVTD